MRAKLVSVGEGKAVLRCDDGRDVTIEIAQLSKADREYIADWRSAGANPFDAPAEVKQQSTRDSTAAVSGDDTTSGLAAAASKEPPIATGALAGGRAVDLEPVQAGWRLPTMTNQAAAGLLDVPIPLPPLVSRDEELVGFFTNEACRRAVLVYQLDSEGGSNRRAATAQMVAENSHFRRYVRDSRLFQIGSRDQQRLVLCDLTTNRALLESRLPLGVELLDLADDGERILLRRRDGDEPPRDRLEIWSAAQSPIKKLAEWIPYGEVNDGKQDLQWARFLGDERVMTRGDKNLAVWKFGATQPLYYLKLGAVLTTSLSADRKWFLFADRREVRLLDVEKGAIRNRHSMPKTDGISALQISPDGLRLAGADVDRIRTWDIASGQLVADMRRASSRFMSGRAIESAGAIHFVGNNFLLVGQSDARLYDLRDQLEIWRYCGQRDVQTLGEVAYFAVSSSQLAPGALVASPLPQAELRDALQQTARDADFFVLQPGDGLQLNLAGVPNVDQRESLRATLIEKLAANDIQVDEHAPLELIVEFDHGKAYEVLYSVEDIKESDHFFMPRPIIFLRPGEPLPTNVKRFQYRPHIVRMRIVYQGKTVWQREITTEEPSTFRFDKNESIEAHLERFNNSDFAALRGMEVPSLLMKSLNSTSPAVAAGESLVTVDGLEEPPADDKKPPP